MTADATTLTTLAARTDTPAGNLRPGARHPQITLIHEQLAALAGTSRETCAKVLHDFADHGLLRLSRGRITGPVRLDDCDLDSADIDARYVLTCRTRPRDDRAEGDQRGEARVTVGQGGEGGDRGDAQRAARVAEFAAQFGGENRPAASRKRRFNRRRRPAARHAPAST
ncbi:helix-turn-helix domain-containing protein [Streptomyces sp. NPDC001530]|uniref:helix-turn-helix domain-containing protein n=1 Tax=Streptomyces sp. NPDC001530 TaxID=3364582 RepID=UPI0036CFFA62